MRHVLFTIFPDEPSAVRASRVLGDDGGATDRVRVHADEIDPHLASDLAGTASQRQLETGVAARFALGFTPLLVLGLALDYARVVPGSALLFTFFLGSIGVVLGTLAVILAPAQPLDLAIDDMQDELQSGRAAVTVRVRGESAAGMRRELEARGGRTIYEA